MRSINGREVYTTLELIHEYGTRSSQFKCSNCDGWALYAIRYPDGRRTLYLCSRCDCEGAG